MLGRPDEIETRTNTKDSRGGGDPADSSSADIDPSDEYEPDYQIAP